MSEVDTILTRMKWYALDAAYHRDLRHLLGNLLTPELPVMAHAVTTSRVRAAVKAAAWQGYDAGRFTSGRPANPYPETPDSPTTVLRRSWWLGFAAGRRVSPRPDPRPLPPVTPIVFAPTSRPRVSVRSPT